jgi:hypothetical protein
MLDSSSSGAQNLSQTSLNIEALRDGPPGLGSCRDIRWLPFGFSQPDRIWLVNNQPPISSRKLVDVTGCLLVAFASNRLPYHHLNIAIHTTTHQSDTSNPSNPQPNPNTNHPQNVRPRITQYAPSTHPPPFLHRNPTNPKPSPHSQRLLPNQQPRLLKQATRRRRRAQSQALLRVQRRESGARRVHAVLHGQRPAGRVRGYGYQVPGLYEGVRV